MWIHQCFLWFPPCSLPGLIVYLASPPWLHKGSSENDSLQTQLSYRCTRVSRMVKKALLVAIKEIKDGSNQGLPQLEFAHRDAQAMYDCLITNHGYRQEDIVLMLDALDTPEDMWPTGSNIMREIQRLVSNPVEGAHYLFYYSGHGIQTPCTDGSEWDGYDEGIIGMDGEYIVDDFLHDGLVVPLNKTKNARLFALFDCCHSETMLDLRRGQYTRFWSGGPGRAFAGLSKSVALLLKCSASANKSKPQLMIDSSTRNQASCLVLSAGDKKRKNSGLIAISLSASRDSQLAFDDVEYGISTTKVFLDVIAQKDITWEELRDSMTERIRRMGERRRLFLPQRSLDTNPDTCAQQPRVSTFDPWTDVNLNIFF
ncbi:peptidase C14, caspase domain-containing protein [Scleroderma citrinum]